MVKKSIRCARAVDLPYTHIYTPTKTELLLSVHHARSDIVYVDLRLLNVWNSNDATQHIIPCTTESTLHTIVHHIESIHHITYNKSSSNINLYQSTNMSQSRLDNLYLQLKQLKNIKIQGSTIQDSTNKLYIYYDYNPIATCPILAMQPAATINTI